MRRRAFVLLLLAHRPAIAGTLKSTKYEVRSATQVLRTSDFVHQTSYVLIDADTRGIVRSRWDDSDRPVPVGSLIKPFTALAYAQEHGFAYPTFTCRGSADSCWLPTGHGSIGIVEAVAGSCNAYFQQLAEHVSPESFGATLTAFGLRSSLATASVSAMVGLGDTVRLAPSAVARAYAELAARANQPGVTSVLDGMMASARGGTGRAVGAALGATDAFVKTGTGPCCHSPRGGGDGYTVVVYPADRPRLVLLAQAHGRTGAETADAAGEILSNAVRSR
jgi:cell division protein FtsI/penicillin-binding protein 2